jgi:salicylate hydroxylase
MARVQRIAIIGAGIGGLTAAIALRQRGFEVALYEQAPLLTEIGAGLQIGPNAVKVYRALGLETELRAIAGEPINAISLNWTDGMVLSRAPMKTGMTAQFGAPHLDVHRGDLLRLLAKPVPDRLVHLGKRCLGIAATPEGAAVRFADGSTIEADLVIGSDGIRSMVRESLFGRDDPRFTGMECWRATLPVEKLTDRRFGAGSRETFDTNDAVNWLGPPGRVVCYPICAGRVFNIFCGHVTTNWVEESWTIPSQLSEVLEAYRGYHETLIKMFLAVDPALWFKWGVFDRDPLPRWTVGRVTLLGDAAHPMPPTLAQGAAMAVEDSFVLARALDQHRDDPDAGLQTYEVERRPFTARAQLQAREQFELNQSVPPKPRLSRDWMFANDVTKSIPAPASVAAERAYDSGEEV